MNNLDNIAKNEELAFWANQVKPLIKYLGGIVKFWTKPLDLKESIYNAEPLMPAHVQKIETLTISLRPSVSFGKPFVTQAMILNQIPKDLLRNADGYVVQLVRNFARGAENSYEATVKLYSALKRPAQVILQKPQFPKIEKKTSVVKDASNRERERFVKDAKTLDLY